MVVFFKFAFCTKLMEFERWFGWSIYKESLAVGSNGSLLLHPSMNGNKKKLGYIL